MKEFKKWTPSEDLVNFGIADGPINLISRMKFLMNAFHVAVLYSAKGLT